MKIVPTEVKYNIYEKVSHKRKKNKKELQVKKKDIKEYGEFCMSLKRFVSSRQNTFGSKLMSLPDNYSTPDLYIVTMPLNEQKNMNK